MQLANTNAANAYMVIVRRIDWAVAPDADQLVVLEDLIKALSGFRGSEAIFEYGMDLATGKRAFDSVNETLNRLRDRQRSRQHCLLQAVGGKVASLRRAVMTARMRMEAGGQLQAA